MKCRRFIRISILFVVFLLVSHMTILASAPKIDNIKDKGKGRIKVEFHGKVSYKNVKVTVKDISGKKYKVKNIKKDSNDIRFTIVKYKAGKTYKITISGVKKKGTRKYGKVTGRCIVPAKGKSKTYLSYSDARAIADGYASDWELYGFYAADGYYSNGYWEFKLLDSNDKECIIIRIDDDIGCAVYLEYIPFGKRSILIIKEVVMTRNYKKREDLWIRNILEIVRNSRKS